MFPDSQIAVIFMWNYKVCLCSVFWHFCYFHVLHIEKIRAVKYYTLSFDESLNQINQKKQMDVIVRFGTAKAIK